MDSFRKCIVWLMFLMGCLLAAHSQNNQWILGVWKGTGITPGSAYSTLFSRTLVIDIESKNQFAGKLIQEVMDNRGTRIEKELTGSIINGEINLRTGRTLYVKQPPTGFWADCSSCKMNNTRISISSDSLMLTNETRSCGDYCDGFTTYYKSLADFDTLTQRKLVRLFGSPLLVKVFKPVIPGREGSSRANTQPAAKPIIAMQERGTNTIQAQLNRKNKNIATYNVSAPGIKIELFDNGEIDGDTVTVYHNKQRIIDRRELGLQPIVYTGKADVQNRVHEFILVANNLGRIPPNTALMRITAGSKTYEIFPTTTLGENVSVIIIYSGE
jgi:hypothetical protein